MARRILALAAWCVSTLTAAPFSKLVFVGDSLTDTGNIFTLTSVVSPLTFGIVPVQPATPPYFSGRFSNGLNWADTVAGRLGQPGASAAAGIYTPFGPLPGQGGNNYAIGGARAGVGGALGAFDSLLPTGVLLQTYFYLSQNGGIADPNALYFVNGGANDIRDIAKLATAAERQAAAANAADLLALSVITLYQSGARNFVFTNAPDVGVTPEARIELKNSAQATESSNFFNQRIGLYNAFFATVPMSSYFFFDLNSFFTDVVNDASSGGKKYGLTNATTPCLPGFSGSTGTNCSVSVFADNLHPTTRVHGLFGNRLADQILGVSSISTNAFAASFAVATPEPGTFVMAGVMLAAIGYLRRR